MNERIEKLAEQAGLEYNFDPMLWLKYEKFAELIVRECVGVADDYVKDCTCEEHVNCKHPQSAIGRKIREHFGVSRAT